MARAVYFYNQVTQTYVLVQVPKRQVPVQVPSLNQRYIKLFERFMQKIETDEDNFAFNMATALRSYHIGYLRQIQKGALLSGNVMIAEVITDVMNNKQRYGDWWPEDDMKLQRLVNEHGENWTEIGQMMMKSPFECEIRYLTICE